MKEERVKEIMNQLGMPNSTSLMLAINQVANEVAQEIRSERHIEKLAALEHDQWGTGQNT